MKRWMSKVKKCVLKLIEAEAGFIWDTDRCRKWDMFGDFSFLDQTWGDRPHTEEEEFEAAEKCDQLVADIISSANREYAEACYKALKGVPKKYYPVIRRCLKAAWYDGHYMQTGIIPFEKQGEYYQPGRAWVTKYSPESPLEDFLKR